MTVDDVGLGFYLLVIPVGGSDELHQIPFNSIDDILLWLECDWPAYESWLCGDSNTPIQLDTLCVDYVGSDGVQYRDSLIARNETGELVVH